MSQLPPKLSVAEIVKHLRSDPVELSVAADSLAHSPGFYAWWAKSGCLPEVPLCAHPAADNWTLLYVGIAPVRATSSSSLYRRVVGNHIRGNIGSSTFRTTLASLLQEQLKLKAILQGKKIKLSREQNRELSDWQREHLRLTWCHCRDPWEVEQRVITALKPPLNLDGNFGHPFYSTLKKAREKLRGSANHG